MRGITNAETTVITIDGTHAYITTYPTPGTTGRVTALSTLFGTQHGRDAQILADVPIREYDDITRDMIITAEVHRLIESTAPADRPDDDRVAQALLAYR